MMSLSHLWQQICERICSGLLFRVGVTLISLFLFFNAQPSVAAGYSTDFEYGYAENSKTAKGVTGIEWGDKYTCNVDTGQASGNLYANTDCTAGGFVGVFTNVICRVEGVLTNALGQLYCATASGAKDAVLAVLVMYITLYGLMLLLGMVEQTFREGITRVLKVAAVGVVLLNADIVINVGFRLYVGGAQTAVGAIFSAFDKDNIENSNNEDLVKSGYLSPGTAADPVKKRASGANWMTAVDAAMDRVISVLINSAIGLLILFIVLAIFAPPLLVLVGATVVYIIQAFAQAIIGYLLALVGLTFLFMLLPIFICFLLFRQTQPWFNKWLKFAASFALQMVIVFAYLGLFVMVDVIGFLENMTTLTMRPTVIGWGPIKAQVSLPSFCKIIRSDAGQETGDIVYYRLGMDGTISNEKTDIKYDGFPKCIPPYTLEQVLSGDRMPPDLTKEDVKTIRETIDKVNSGEIQITSEKDEDNGLEKISQIIEKENDELFYGYSELFDQGDLIYFFIIRFMIVLLLSFLMVRYMKTIPHVATSLAGDGAFGRLGGGAPMGAAGVQRDDGDFMGLQSAWSGFTEGLSPKGGRPQRPHLIRAIRGGMRGWGSGLASQALKASGDMWNRPRLHRDEHSDQAEHLRSGDFVGRGRPGYAQTGSLGRNYGQGHNGGSGTGYGRGHSRNR